MKVNIKFIKLQAEKLKTAEFLKNWNFSGKYVNLENFYFEYLWSSGFCTNFDFFKDDDFFLEELLEHKKKIEQINIEILKFLIDLLSKEAGILEVAFFDSHCYTTLKHLYFEKRIEVYVSCIKLFDINAQVDLYHYPQIKSELESLANKDNKLLFLNVMIKEFGDCIFKDAFIKLQAEKLKTAEFLKDLNFSGKYVNLENFYFKYLWSVAFCTNFEFFKNDGLILEELLEHQKKFKERNIEILKFLIDFRSKEDGIPKIVFFETLKHLYFEKRIKVYVSCIKLFDINAQVDPYHYPQIKSELESLANKDYKLLFLNDMINEFGDCIFKDALEE